MMQKLLNPGLNYEHLGEKTIDNIVYDIVKITFLSEDQKPKDFYQLYVNKKTSLVEQFLFTIAGFGIMNPKFMQVEHQNVDGLMIPTKRQYKNSTWDAEVNEEPWILVSWTDIAFNLGVPKDGFNKEEIMK